MLPNGTHSFEIQRPALESCRAEAMLLLFIAKRCFYTVDRHELLYCMKTCNRLKEIVMNCVSYKQRDKLQLRCSKSQNVDW